MASAAAKERLHTFFVVKEPGKPDRIIVWDTQDVTVGRAPENDVTIDHGEISRRQAVFTRLKNAYAVKNLSTSNATQLNGESVQTQPLRSKDVVRMAEVDFVFYQVAKNPVTLGPRVEYASQLKDFGPGGATNPEATMLGLTDAVDEGDDDDFQVGPASAFAYDLHNMEVGKGPAPRNLDLELEAPALDSLDMPAKEESWSLDELPAAPEEPKPAPPQAPRPQAPPQQAPPPQAPRPQAPPQQAAPRPAAPAPAARAARSTLSLHIEIDGLEGELRALAEALRGKTLALPALRIRIKGDDLA